MKAGKWDIGICNWSLHTEIEKAADIINDLGVDHVHLAIGNALGADGDKYLSTVKEQNWTISSTMLNFAQEDYSSLESIKITGGIAPDDRWDANKDLFVQAAKLTAQLGVKYLSMHAGFIDETDAEYAAKFTSRIQCLADIAGENNVMLLLETGQESGLDLKEFLENINHPALGVNFDPANMILYDKGDPIEAVKTLAPWIKHVHIKDAVRTETPGTWGSEVPWGTGQVGSTEFLKTLKEIGYDGTLAIEREAGVNRTDDIRSAVEILAGFEG